MHHLISSICIRFRVDLCICVILCWHCVSYFRYSSFRGFCAKEWWNMLKTPEKYQVISVMTGATQSWRSSPTTRPRPSSRMGKGQEAHDHMMGRLSAKLLLHFLPLLLLYFNLLLFYFKSTVPNQKSPFRAFNLFKFLHLC